MAENPFEILEGRLNRIEDLLFTIQQQSKDHTTPPKDLGGVEIAVDETGLSSHSIYRLASERKIPHSKRGGRLYFSRKALRSWINEGNRTVRK